MGLGGRVHGLWRGRGAQVWAALRIGRAGEEGGAAAGGDGGDARRQIGAAGRGRRGVGVSLRAVSCASIYSYIGVPIQNFLFLARVAIFAIFSERMPE